MILWLPQRFFPFLTILFGPLICYKWLIHVPKDANDLGQLVVLAYVDYFIFILGLLFVYLRPIRSNVAFARSKQTSILWPHQLLSIYLFLVRNRYELDQLSHSATNAPHVTWEGVVVLAEYDFRWPIPSLVNMWCQFPKNSLCFTSIIRHAKSRRPLSQLFLRAVNSLFGGG